MISIQTPKILLNFGNLFEKRFLLRFDGCSKGNPGLAGAGAVLYYDKEEIWSDYKFLNKQTNNQAEYNGLLLGLNYAVNSNITSLYVEGDSLLVINQMTGKFKCDSINIIDLHKKAKQLERQFDFIQFNHIYRDKNKRADELANLAIPKQ
jgi:ribonuclease HI